MTTIRGLASLWTTKNPILVSAEEGVEKDTGRFKIGDGTTRWNSLVYAAINAFSIHASSSKATPVDADELPMLDSAASFGEAKLSWANLKATFVAYYNTLTATFTNKRITARVVTVTQSATPTINTDNTDVASITGLAQAITSMTTNLTGTPVAGDRLVMEVTDNGTARAITWGAKFEAGTLPLPTTTVASTKLTAVFLWNTVTSAWRLLQTSNYDTLTVTETNKTLTAPKVDVLATTSGSWVLGLTHGGSVNLLAVTNAATGVAPSFGVNSISGDTNVDLNLVSKGTGTVKANAIQVVTRSIATVTTTTTLGAVSGNEYFVLLNTGAVVTLPTAVGNASVYVFKNITGTSLTVATTSSQTIEGSIGWTLAPNESITVVSTQTNWVIL